MKTTLRTLLFILIPLAGFAQETASPLKFGINAGATYAGVRGNADVDAFDYALDYLVGVSFEAPLNDHFSLLTNLNYERKSYGTEIQVLNGDPFDPILSYRNVDLRYTLQYLTLPVNLKYYIGQSRGFYVNGGVFAGYLLDAISKVDGNKESSPAGVSKDFDFGLNLGAGIRFSLDEKSSLNIEVRDNLGLVNINGLGAQGAGDVRTNSVNLIIGWQFGL